ncbi:MAG: aspartate kinase [Planctomycetota bacterium]
MSLIVQKFGGTSVENAGKIRAAAERAIHAKLSGNDVVVVVSARGQTTDELQELAFELSDNPPTREMDQLLSTGEQESVALVSIAIHAAGHKAMSFTGGQAGILTDSFHSKAKIRSIDTGRIRQALTDGNIVIVAGFQGVDEKANITTLGRGGSDTTAVALAAALRADSCEIYTDVPGVFTADPRIIPEARKLEMISYDEMLELASLGAGVLQTRSVEFAKKYGIPIHVRSSSSNELGTFVCLEAGELARGPVTGVALRTDEAKVTLRGVRDVPGVAAKILGAIAEANINIDMIIQNVGADGRTDFSFTVNQSELKRTLEVCREIAREVGARDLMSDREIAKVSVVGEGMRRHPGVAHGLFAALAARSINIEMISTSEIKISCVVDAARAREAAQAAHETFGLAQVRQTTRARPELPSKVSPIELPEMEAVYVSAADLSTREAKVTVRQVPDVPGIVAKLFRGVARTEVDVNVIVQNSSDEGMTDVTFTVEKDGLGRALDAARAAGRELGAKDVDADAEVAVLSVSGVGMRSHAGVARRMFSALAEENINIQVISTSEMKISCVVDAKDGARALAAVKDAFKL